MMLFLSFAWTGLMLGYLSLLEVQIFLRNFSPNGWFILSVMALLLVDLGSIWVDFYDGIVGI